MKVSEIKQLLEKTGLRPTRDRGQNFLVDENVVEDILDTAAVGEVDRVLEIGPGPGLLTERLLKRGARVVAVELDRILANEVSTRLASDRLEVVISDFLELEDDFLATRFAADDYQVVANLPYSITSAAVVRLLAARPRPVSLTLMVQREVAERICARPPKMSVLSVLVQLHGSPRIVRKVPAGCFWPAPKVDSAVLHVPLLKAEELNERLHGLDPEKFMEVVRCGFSSRRKQLKNVLSARFPSVDLEQVLSSMGLDPRVRAEALSPDMWIELVFGLTR